MKTFWNYLAVLLDRDFLARHVELFQHGSDVQGAVEAAGLAIERDLNHKAK
jgi:hypothetical protein